jgi:ABC-type sugar transport system substrate-binding protein
MDRKLLSFECRWLQPRFGLLLVTAVISLGCSNSTAPAPAANKKIAVVVSTLNNPWFVVLGEAARDRAVELGYEATIFDSENDPTKEAANIDNVITDGYAAILFNPVDSAGSVTAARRAKDAGVPVFCIDREINASDVAESQLVSDSYSGCVALGQYFVERMGEEGNYVQLLGVLGDNNTWNRSKGFHSVVDRYPGWKMVAQQEADCDRAKALEVMESILQSQEDVDAVFCGNDAMAMGAYQALLAAGRADEVQVFGFDGAAEVVELVQQGKVAATVMQYPRVMSQTAAEQADQFFRGKRDFEQKTSVAVDLVTPDNVAEFIAYGRKDDASKETASAN